ncbi:MAG: preprotein translocase subunit YajC [Clostridia bacterium]|nr:preprotein translocase subunit YajC [Clostridia bacterium]MBQ8369083.1 preprotein translocase subunit YajC [Clostridia bacterium]MBQ8513243.1 preprotein translocase subunit YajC [Clostridia bacterium]
MYYFLTSGDQTVSPGANAATTLIMLVAMVAIFYFFMYRPQKKQDKEQNDMRNNLKVGDEITTIGGIIGKIVSIKDETVLIETSNERNKIRILRTAVRNVDVHAEDAD